MSEIPFYSTRMGRTFYEHTMSELVRQLSRLNDLLERLAHHLPADANKQQHRNNEDAR